MLFSKQVPLIAAVLSGVATNLAVAAPFGPATNVPHRNDTHWLIPRAPFDPDVVPGLSAKGQSAQTNIEEALKTPPTPPTDMAAFDNIYNVKQYPNGAVKDYNELWSSSLNKATGLSPDMEFTQFDTSDKVGGRVAYGQSVSNDGKTVIIDSMYKVYDNNDKDSRLMVADQISYIVQKAQPGETNAVSEVDMFISENIVEKNWVDATKSIYEASPTNLQKPGTAGRWSKIQDAYHNLDAENFPNERNVILGTSNGLVPQRFIQINQKVKPRVIDQVMVNYFKKSMVITFKDAPPS